MRYLLLAIKVSSPSPLNLNCSYMVHGEAMILKQTPCQCHFVSSLNKSCAEVSPALLFTFMEYVKRRGEELRSQFLGSSEMLQLACVAEFVVCISSRTSMTTFEHLLLMLLLKHKLILLRADFSCHHLVLFSMFFVEEASD